MKIENVKELRSAMIEDEFISYLDIHITTRIEVLGEGFSLSGEPYYHFNLYDSTGSIRAYGQCTHWDQYSIEYGSIHSLSLQTINSQAGLTLLAFPQIGAPPTKRTSLDLLPIHQAPKVEDVERLIEMATWITIPSYKTFLLDIFCDPKFALDFICAPASRDCHHSAPGGLLSHSLEVATYVCANATFMGMAPLMTQASTILSLIHDIGKVRLSQPDAHTLPTRDHEALIEYELSEPMNNLKRMDLDAYNIFWHLLRAYRSRMTYEAPIVGLIRAFDGCSAQNDALRKSSKRFNSRHRVKAGSRSIYMPPNALPRKSGESLHRP